MDRCEIYLLWHSFVLFSRRLVHGTEEVTRKVWSKKDLPGIMIQIGYSGIARCLGHYKGMLAMKGVSIVTGMKKNP